jgi:hypothetical protein
MLRLKTIKRLFTKANEDWNESQETTCSSTVEQVG